MRAPSTRSRVGGACGAVSTHAADRCALPRRLDPKLDTKEEREKRKELREREKAAKERERRAYMTEAEE